MQGLATGNEVRIPFLADFEAYARFLLAIPLLILAENSIGFHIAEAVRHFVEAGLIPEQNIEQLMSVYCNVQRTCAILLLLNFCSLESPPCLSLPLGMSSILISPHGDPRYRTQAAHSHWQDGGILL